jgi:hypothetical protein
MTATPIAVTQLSRSGTANVAATAGDTVNGNSVTNDGKVFFDLINTDATASHTLTVAAAVAGPDGLTIGSKVITVVASGAYKTDLWPPSTYGTLLQLTVDSTHMTISPYRHS